MIKSAKKYPLSEIFQNDRDIRYVIPRYQREYTWGKDNLDDLLMTYRMQIEVQGGFRHAQRVTKGSRAIAKNGRALDASQNGVYPGVTLSEPYRSKQNE